MKNAHFLLLITSLVSFAQAQWESIPEAAWNFKALAYEKCGATGHRHGSIDKGRQTLLELANRMGFEVTISDDNNDFTQENLAQYDVILLNNTTKPQESLNSDQQAALIWYVEEFAGTGTGGRDRGGVFGWHGAMDMALGASGEWPWYHDWLGGTYNGATGGQGTSTRAAEVPAGHPLNIIFQGIPDEFTYSEEWYKWETPPESKEGVIPVLWLEGTGDRRTMTWSSTSERALSVFSSIGHADGMFDEEIVQNLFIGSILYVSGYGQVAGVEGCMDPLATNYDPLATDPCTDCCTGTGVLSRSSRPVVNILNNSIYVAAGTFHTLKTVNVNGESVFSMKGEGARTYDLSGLEPGIYFVQVTTGSHEFNGKIFRQ